MMNWLERLQKVAPISTWALFGAGIALSLMQAAMVLLLWRGGWDLKSEHQRLDYIGWIAILLALDLMAVIASLAKARVAVRGPGGFSADVDGGAGDAAAGGAKVTVEVPKP